MIARFGYRIAIFGLVALAVWQAGRALAAELDTLVPDDAGLTVEIRNLAAHTEQFQAGELYRRLKTFPAFEKWFAEHGHEVATIAGRLHIALGASVDELGTKLLGRQVLLAVWPAAEPGHDGTALLLVRTGERKLLESVIERVVSGQKKAGKWKEARAINEGQRTYQVQVFEAGGAGAFAFVVVLDEGDPGAALGVMTTDEKILRRVLAAHGGSANAAGDLASLPAYQDGIRRLAPDVTVRAFLNPRPWDKLMLAGLEPSEKTPPLVKQAIVETWIASQYAVASIEVNHDVSFEAFWQCNSATLPDTVRNLLASASGRTDIVDRAPVTSLAAAAGRVDFGRLVRSFFLPTSSGRNRGLVRLPNRDVGSAIVMSLVSGLGPDLGAFLVPSASTDDTESLWPLDWVVGVETQAVDESQGQTTLAESLEPLVRMALSLAAANDNARSADASGGTSPAAKVETIDIDRRKVTSIWGLPQMGPNRPLVYSVTDGHVWAATSVQALRPIIAASDDASTKGSLAQSPRLRKLLSPRVGDPSGLVFVDLTGLRRLLESSPRAIDGLAALKRLDRAAAERNWQELQAVLNLADGFVAQAKVEASGVSLAVRVSGE